MPQHDPLPGVLPDGSDWDENPVWQQAVRDMTLISRQLPEGEWAVAAMHNMAQLIVEMRPALTREHEAVLIGVGALLAREGMKEMGALFDAWNALGMLRQTPRSLGGAA